MASLAQNNSPKGGAKASPNRTLYVKNLNDKLNKEDLRRSLYLLFSTYGTVLGVIALKTMKMRGQAHIVFRDTPAAIQAMRTLQGFELFGRPMVIEYSKSGKSTVISKLEGVFQQKSDTVNEPVLTSLQDSIFNKPPPASAQVSGGMAAGEKRKREDESDAEEQPMEQDEEEEQEMDVSDED